MANVLMYLLYAVHALVSILLILLVMGQTARHEGLGVAGGQSGPSLRGRAGMDEQLANYTKVVAVVWMVLSAMVYFTAMKVGFR